MTHVMAELHTGYGDGYGVIAVTDIDQPVTEPGSKATHYSDGGGKIEKWKRDLLAQPGVIVDGRVKVPTGAVKRIIGPLDCPEAVRVRIKRYLSNCYEAANRLLSVATDEELLAVVQSNDWHGAIAPLWKKYPEANVGR